MSRGKRIQSEGDIYHIVIRGVGRQIIFEENADMHYFKKMLADQAQEFGIEIYAWCLMENHVHLLLRAQLGRIAAFMRYIEIGYAKYFNKKYDRVGTLFQGRYTSVPVESDEQLMTVVRYIHHNPAKAGKSLAGPYSSYAEYTGHPSIASTDFVLGVFGGKAKFVAFHAENGARTPELPAARLSSAQAAEMAKEILGDMNPFDVKALPKARRNELLAQLKDAGLSIRQIERLTSIGRSIIARA